MVTGRLNDIEKNCSYCYCNINLVIISKNKSGEGEDQGGKNNTSVHCYKRTHKK